MINPLVSIIIPVLNQKDNLQKCLDSIFDQNYPKEKIEVLVIDNGSTDGSWELLDVYNVLKFKLEGDKSPYICRNFGITKSNGQILVFSDSRMIPENNTWLSNGVDCLSKSNKEVVMGKIKVAVEEMNSLSNWCEAIDMLRFNFFAEENKAFLFNNTFILKERFLKIGYFDEKRSGSDSIWVKKAIENDFTIELCKAADSYYITKSFHPLLRKFTRTGFYSLKRQQKNNKYWVTYVFRKIIEARPPNPFILERIWEREELPMKSLTWWIRFVFLLWFFRVIKSLSALGIPITRPD